MHGLVNRSIERFICDTYDTGVWRSVVAAAGLDYPNFEAMLTYDDKHTHAVFDAATSILDRSSDELMEDIGTYLVSHERASAVRRLLRFGGETFLDFLYSLEDLPERVKLAVPDLEFPQLELVDVDTDSFKLKCYCRHVGYAHVIVGALCSMADNYGALATIEHRARRDEVDEIAIKVIDASFCEGSRFSLANNVEA